MGAEKPLKKTSQMFYWDPGADIKVWMASRQAYEDHRNIVACNLEESSSSRQCSFWSWEIGIMYSVTVLSSVLGSYFVQDKSFFLKYVYITGSDSLGLGIPGPKCCCLLGKGRREREIACERDQLTQYCCWAALSSGYISLNSSENKTEQKKTKETSKKIYLGFIWKQLCNI